MKTWRYLTQCANNCKICLVMPYSQYLVLWLILTNTVLNIAKICRQHKCNYTQNPWTIPNHRCSVSRGVPVLIILGAEVPTKLAGLVSKEGGRTGHITSQEDVSSLFTWSLVPSQTSWSRITGEFGQSINLAGPQTHHSQGVYYLLWYPRSFDVPFHFQNP